MSTSAAAAVILFEDWAKSELKTTEFTVHTDFDNFLAGLGTQALEYGARPFIVDQREANIEHLNNLTTVIDAMLTVVKNAPDFYQTTLVESFKGTVERLIFALTKKIAVERLAVIRQC